MNKDQIADYIQNNYTDLANDFIEGHAHIAEEFYKYAERIAVDELADEGDRAYDEWRDSQ